MKISLPQNFNPPKALKIYDYEDVAIQLYVANLKPHQFNLQKLREHQIIPLSWRLKKSSHKQAGTLHYCFVSGINITFIKGRVIFAQKIMNPDWDLGEIIAQFIRCFNNYHYLRAQIILRRVITLPTQKNSGAKFIQEKLLNGKQWSLLGQKPIKRQVNYYYPHLDEPLSLNIVDLTLNNKQIKARSCLLFRGMYDYQADQKNQLNFSHELMAIVVQYREKVKSFRQIIDRDFLNN